MKNLAPMKGSIVVLPCVEYMKVENKTVNMLSKNMGEITLQTRGGSILYPSVNTGN